MQHVVNPPKCPVCGTDASDPPMKLVILNNSDVLDGSAMSFPVLVCPKDGIIFAVQP